MNQKNEIWNYRIFMDILSTPEVAVPKHQVQVEKEIEGVLFH